MPEPDAADAADAADPASANDADRSPVEHLVEYLVYAPLGLALEARNLLPNLIDRGRAQIGVARMIGEFAVKWGSVRFESSIVDAQDQAMILLRRSGLAGSEERDRSPGAEVALEVAERVDTGSSTAEPNDGLAAPARDHDGPDIDPSTLAIPDYDNLSASQVVPRLDGLTAGELEAVRAYEQLHRGRKTILNKVAQLQDPAG